MDGDCISRLVAIVCEGLFRLIVFWGVPPLSLFGMLLALGVVGWCGRGWQVFIIY